MTRAAPADLAISRRRFMAASAAFAALAAAPAWAEALPGALDAEALGVRPGDADQSRALTRALERAAREGRPLTLGPGVYRVSNVTLPDGAMLVGAPHATRLELSGSGPVLKAKGAKRLALRGLTFDGGAIPGAAETGVLEFADVATLAIDDVTVLDAGANCLMLLRSGGTVRDCRFEGARQAALFSIDGKGLSLTDSVILGCRNNGVLLRRNDKADESSVISRNRIEDTGALDGGLGWNGNAINVSKAGGVMISGNAIRRSAFSAVRAHAADDVMITDNLCLDSGETCIFAEYGFSGAVISSNLVDGAGNGICVANFNEGGRLGTIVGNVVRNLFRRKKLDGPGESYGLGIGVEADVAVTGNVVENAPTAGINAGWGPYLRDVTISGNVVRGCDVGISVSVVEGVGPATIVGNTVTGFRRGGVLGYRWDKAATPDLAVGGSGGLPGLTVAQNTLK